MDRRRFLTSVGGALAVPAFAPRVFSAPALPRARLALRARMGPFGRQRPSAYIERWSWAMGQPVRLRLYAESEAHGHEAAQAAFAELRRVERHLSLFDPTSDLTALNDRAGRGMLRVDPQLSRVLRVAEWVRRQTGGAFDPAVEPVMRAWGFHATRTAPPSVRELQEARAAVAAARVGIDGRAVSLAGGGSALDLGGIGVGAGLDQAAVVLRRRGIPSALLDVSGDLIAIGAPPGARGWRVDIADPRKEGATIGTTHLRDQALATSANTESVIRYQGLLAGHVMDPRTAHPADRVTQATVVAPSGILADAYSTASLVAPVALPAGCRVTVVR